MGKLMNERDIERKCCRIAEQHGCMSMKMVSPNRAGVPDRLFLKGAGRIQFVEFKKPGGKPRPIQDRTIRLFAVHGHKVAVIDNVEDFKELMGFE